jgi:alkanesulfonate monooxygenase SsuD/methylene tetrahydromethanopterin reductase-like flavin-dependent oxidoreductase (luciferase family)
LTEHHLHENQGYQNSLLFACALAPRLKQATLILATVNPALHHPVRLVESCNLIDQLNAGRLVVVFGSGFKDTDLVAFGRDLADRNALFDKGMRTVLDIWAYDGTGGPLEFAVGADRGRLDVAVNPSSFRKPRPILARGTLNPASVADAAARGWPVFTAIKDLAGAREQMASYHAALAASGHDPETIKLAREWSSVGKAVHVADTDEQARSEAEAFFAKNPSGAIARNPDDMICGSPETVTREMRAFAASGVGVMICGFLIDLADQSRLRRSVRLFEEQVMPNVAGHA